MTVCTGQDVNSHIFLEKIACGEKICYDTVYTVISRDGKIYVVW